ncbi:hypothetical protein A2U01_0094715, partial [Trifolium medium]|nr:hypothetical protein [Trifolium medium]
IEVWNPLMEMELNTDLN